MHVVLRRAALFTSRLFSQVKFLVSGSRSPDQLVQPTSPLHSSLSVTWTHIGSKPIKFDSNRYQLSIALLYRITIQLISNVLPMLVKRIEIFENVTNIPKLN